MPKTLRINFIDVILVKDDETVFFVNSKPLIDFYVYRLVAPSVAATYKRSI